MIREELNELVKDNLQKHISWTEDVEKNAFGWLNLDHPSKIVDAAIILANRKARLATITAYTAKRVDKKKRLSVAYHFVVDNILLTVCVPLFDAETFEILPIHSITPYFRNADWNEREFKEMYNVDIIGHPNPRRLFLDERLDAGIMGELVPFSVISNSATTQKLWETIMESKVAQKAIDEQAAFAAMHAPLPEPSFTPVAEKKKEEAAENNAE